jgi:hypothetical protein
LIDPRRAEFGFHRTVCCCAECIQNCHYIPGYLIPSDLNCIHKHLAPDQDLFTWAHHHLLASPGAKVMQRGKIFRIRTLVPARQSHGTCIFLTADERCAIHPIAPFGCAFFDAHQSPAESDRRSMHGLQAVLEAWAKGDPYAQIWLSLDNAGLRAPALETCRQQLRQAQDRTS